MGGSCCAQSPVLYLFSLVSCVWTMGDLSGKRGGMSMQTLVQMMRTVPFPLCLLPLTPPFPLPSRGLRYRYA